jgi:hypothetical protein
MAIRGVSSDFKLNITLKKTQLIKALKTIFEYQPEGWRFHINVGSSYIEFISAYKVVKVRKKNNLNPKDTIIMYIGYHELLNLFRAIRKSQKDRITLSIEGKTLSYDRIKQEAHVVIQEN